MSGVDNNWTLKIRRVTLVMQALLSSKAKSHAFRWILDEETYSAPKAKIIAIPIFLFRGIFK